MSNFQTNLGDVYFSISGYKCSYCGFDIGYFMNFLSIGVCFRFLCILTLVFLTLGCPSSKSLQPYVVSLATNYVPKNIQTIERMDEHSIFIDNLLNCRLFSKEEDNYKKSYVVNKYRYIGKSKLELTLTSGLKFINNQRLTTKDVLATYSHWPANGVTGYLYDSIKSLYIISDQTMVFEFDESIKKKDFLSYLTVGLLSSSYLKKSDKKQLASSRCGRYKVRGSSKKVLKLVPSNVNSTKTLFGEQQLLLMPSTNEESKLIDLQSGKIDAFIASNLQATNSRNKVDPKRFTVLPIDFDDIYGLKIRSFDSAATTNLVAQAVSNCLNGACGLNGAPQSVYWGYGKPKSVKSKVDVIKQLNQVGIGSRDLGLRPISKIFSVAFFEDEIQVAKYISSLLLDLSIELVVKTYPPGEYYRKSSLKILDDMWLSVDPISRQQGLDQGVIFIPLFKKKKYLIGDKKLVDMLIVDDLNILKLLDY